MQKSDAMKTILSTMISISGRKITQGDAISTMDTVLKNLEKHYDFLKHVQINDTRFSEDGEMIHIESELNTTNTNELGEAINEIVTTMHHSLGKHAGFFFIKELQKRLGDDYISYIKDMGVDLSLLQLESEVIKFPK